MGVADFTGQPAVFIPNKWPISPKYPPNTVVGGWVTSPPSASPEKHVLISN
jgi:hypothetical protein